MNLFEDLPDLNTLFEELRKTRGAAPVRMSIQHNPILLPLTFNEALTQRVTTAGPETKQ